MTYRTLRSLCVSLLLLLTFGIVGLAADPGSPIPNGATNDQQPGSVLVYNLYSSKITDEGEDTRISITNVNTTQSAYVHLFFVSPACSTADSYICLTPNQTASFLASDVDPGTRGYIIAVATELATGIPTSHNFLIGDALVKLATKHEAKLNAVAFQALFNGPLSTSTDPILNLPFDGVSYSKAPRVLALDHIPSVADKNNTILIINSLNGNLATGITPIGTLFGILYDDTENAFSFTIPGGCQFFSALSDSFPRTRPSFETIIPTQRSGWLKTFSMQDRAIVGASLNFSKNTGGRRNAFSGGSNLHHLTNTTGAINLAIPVFPPAC